jgi:hypothetical protein
MMSKESTIVKAVQKITCSGSDTGGHCWHYANHQHAVLDKCCFCGKNGSEIFGQVKGMRKEEKKEAKQEPKKADTQIKKGKGK